MTLQQKLKRIGDSLAVVVPNSYHYFRPQLQPPYLVWAEDGEADSFDADNHKKEQVVSGFIDYYTKEEYDPTMDTIQETLNTFDFPFGWRLASTDYEDETNLIHYSWDFSVG